MASIAVTAGSGGAAQIVEGHVLPHQRLLEPRLALAEALERGGAAGAAGHGGRRPRDHRRGRGDGGITQRQHDRQRVAKGHQAGGVIAALGVLDRQHAEQAAARDDRDDIDTADPERRQVAFEQPGCPAIAARIGDVDRRAVAQRGEQVGELVAVQFHSRRVVV